MCRVRWALTSSLWAPSHPELLVGPSYYPEPEPEEEHRRAEQLSVTVFPWQPTDWSGTTHKTLSGIESSVQVWTRPEVPDSLNKDPPWPTWNQFVSALVPTDFYISARFSGFVFHQSVTGRFGPVGSLRPPRSFSPLINSSIKCQKWWEKPKVTSFVPPKKDKEKQQIFAFTKQEAANVWLKLRTDYDNNLELIFFWSADQLMDWWWWLWSRACIDQLTHH